MHGTQIVFEFRGTMPPLQDYCDGKIDCKGESDEESDCNPDGRNECLLPITEHGNYTILDNIEYVSGELIPNNSLVNIYCVNHNSTLTKQYNTIACVNGSFYQELPKCISCATTFPNGINVDCKLGWKTEDCIKHNVRVGTIANMKCKPNFIDKNPEITKSQCLANSSWDVLPKQCISPFIDRCPPIPSFKIDVHCVLDGVTQDCSKEVPDGTHAEMTCKSNYIDVDDDDRPKDSSCLNGTWSRPPRKCIPDCNGIVLEGKPFIVNGSSANSGDFPWHVAIYRQKSLNPRGGGSIISVKVVLSAAHCLTNIINGKIYPSSQFSVAAGKTYMNWDADDDEYYAQKRNVASIHIRDDIYFWELSHYIGDFVHAVCVDWNLEYTNQQLVDGSFVSCSTNEHQIGVFTRVTSYIDFIK